MSEETMTTAGEVVRFLEELACREIRLCMDGEQLRFRSRPGALTAELRARVEQNRAALITFLKAAARPDVPGTPPEITGKEAARGESVQELIAWLQARDIELAVNDGKLKVSGPKGAMDNEVRTRIAAHRDDLVVALSAPQNVGVVSVRRSGDYPLSHNQQRLWFLKQMDPNSTAYNILTTVRLRGTIDASTLELALNAVIDRHESLRTRFVSIDGSPRCLIEPQVNFRITMMELSGGQGGTADGEAIARALETMHQPFDLGRCPLLRVQLLRFKADHHILVVVIDHIIADGISLNIFVGEWLERYARYSAGDDRPLAPLQYRYLDFADWQRRWLAAGALEQSLAYWKGQLAGIPPAIQLPTDRPRPAMQTYAGARFVSSLSEEETRQLQSLARREKATLFMVLMSAFQALLHRYTSETDIVVGTATANRSRPEFSRVIGFFANNIVLRGNFTGNPTIREAIGRAREMALEGFQHEDTPFDVLVDALGPRRSLDHSPLFQVMFVLQNQRVGDSPVPTLEMELLEPAPRTSRFDLTVDAFDRGNGLVFHFEYNTDLFEPETIERMSQHYRAMLAGYIEHPDKPVANVPLLSAAELTRLTADWNRTQVRFDEPRVVHECFEAQAASRPDAVAVRFGETQVTYSELDARANRLAHHLIGLDLGGDRLVGVCMERSIDMVVALLAVLKAGFAYLPLDPAFPQERIAFMMEDARLGAIATQRALATKLPPNNARTIRIDTEWDEIGRYPPSKPEVAVDGGDLCYVIYTSGSTGEPKGVEIEHRNLVNFLHSMRREPGLTPDDTLLSVTTLSFDIAGLEIWLPLTTGARVVVARRDEVQDADRLSALITRNDVTVLQATPATWRLLLSAGWAGKSDLKVLCGGEALPRDLAQTLIERVGELWNMYGPTETTIWSTVTRIADHSRGVSIGHPIANTRVYVFEPSGLPAPIGVLGELCIAGDGVARGYRKRPELTAEKFVTVTLPDGRRERVYRTGDMARFRSDAQLEFVGRRDHQVKVRGYRIELEEIEGVLATHPGVKECVVIAHDSPDGQRLVGYVIPTEGSEFDSSAAQSTLRMKLPDYMIPNLFMVLPALPLTANGKVDRLALPAPEPEAQLSERAGTAPRTVIEKQLAAIWEEILGIQQIGVHTNFFDVGGHSLLIIRMIDNIKRKLSVMVSGGEVFQNPTVEMLAQLIERRPVNKVEPRVLQLQMGSGSQPVYFIHAGPDESNLARLMGHGHAIFGIEVPWPVAWCRGGLARQNSALPSIEQFIAPYAEALNAHLLAPSCVLAGHSFAGIIAFEVARKLQTLGRRVDAVILFDTLGRVPSLKEVALFFLRKYRKWPPSQSWGVRALQEISSCVATSSTLARLIMRYAAEKILSSVLRALGLKAAQPTNILNEDGVPLEWGLIELLYEHLGKGYQPELLNAPGVLFRAEPMNETLRGVLGEDLGWAGAFGGGLEIIPVTGDHISMIRSAEHNIVLAKKTRDMLNRIKICDRSVAFSRQ